MTTSPGLLQVEYQHVLVPLDGSELAADALRPAAEVAQRLGATLHTVSVVPAPSDTAAMRAHAHELGVDDDRVAVVVGADAAGTIDARRRELGSCLVCMSTRGRGRLGGAVLGSVARDVFTAAGSPIIAMGPFVDRAAPFVESYLAPPLAVPRLVACVDGGPVSDTVVDVAAAFANALELSLTILTVAEPVARPLHTDAVWRRRYGPHEDADAFVERMRDARREVVADVEGVVVYDPVGVTSGVMAHLAMHPAGMLCVSTTARTGMERIRFGADAANIVRASPLPVLVVPPIRR